MKTESELREAIRNLRSECLSLSVDIQNDLTVCDFEQALIRLTEIQDYIVTALAFESAIA